MINAQNNKNTSVGGKKEVTRSHRANHGPLNHQDHSFHELELRHQKAIVYTRLFPGQKLPESILQPCHDTNTLVRSYFDQQLQVDEFRAAAHVELLILTASRNHKKHDTFSVFAVRQLLRRTRISIVDVPLENLQIRLKQVFCIILLKLRHLAPLRCREALLEYCVAYADKIQAQTYDIPFLTLPKTITRFIEQYGKKIDDSDEECNAQFDKKNRYQTQSQEEV